MFELIIIEIFNDATGYLIRFFRNQRNVPNPVVLPNFENVDLSVLSDDDVSQSFPMKPEVFCVLRGRRQESLDKIIRDGELVPGLVDHQGNSILHIAAGSGHLNAVHHIVSFHPGLIKRQNTNGDTALHVAAGAGYDDVVMFLVRLITHISGDISLEESEKLNQIYIVQNSNLDTPLHIALNANHVKIASSLVIANPRAALLANKDNTSPLYLAMQARSIKLVKIMMRSFTVDHVNPSFEGYSIMHAAIKTRRIDIINAVLAMDQNLINLKDEKGRTCLSFAAFKGYYNEVCYLLEKSPSYIYVNDDDGFFPIHMAAKGGHGKVIRKIRKCCPDSMELVNKEGQNLLHIAAENGSNAFQYLLNCDIGGKMLNEQDGNGNTPFHLATMHRRVRVVIHLVNNGRSNPHLKNNDGQTVMDIAEANLHSVYKFRERMILVLLTYAYTPTRFSMVSVIKSRSQHLDHKLHQAQANTLLLVATLLAAIAFAAGFTVPGGYNSSLPNLGMAVLAKRAAFKIFMICDTIAMAGSATAIATLLWAQLGDADRLAMLVEFSLVFLGLAILAMPMGFIAAAFLIVSYLSHFSFIILGIAVLVLLPVPFFFVPVYMPFIFILLPVIANVLPLGLYPIAKEFFFKLL